MDRYFTLEYVEGLNNKGGGRYKGDSPMKVAKNIAVKLFNQYIMKKKIVFNIRETTKDSRKKTFSYIAIKNGNKINIGVYKRIFVGGGTDDDIGHYSFNDLKISKYDVVKVKVNVIGTKQQYERSYTKKMILDDWEKHLNLHKLSDFIETIYNNKHSNIIGLNLFNR